MMVFGIIILMLLAAAALATDDEGCQLYLAPSQLKENASHGFGLGIFTGRHIYEGELLNDLNEIIIPLYDSSMLDITHPPLREYLWPTMGTLPELAIHSNDRMKSFWFAGGISSMAPCTSVNFNVENNAAGEMVGALRWNLNEDYGVPSREDPHAGSFSYRHNATYLAARDIAPGEELIVDCFDDNFDGLSLTDKKRNNMYKSNDVSYMCLDNVKSGESQVPGIGKGLLAGRSISKEQIILSSPVVPINRRDLIGDGTGKTAQSGINNYQLMLNYALGHDDSDLLLLPYGPFVNFINHPPPGKMANAVIRWHPFAENEIDVPRRMQFHHSELFQQYAKAVTETHGKGLVIDIVALDQISADDEIYIDYGSSWTKAWNDHVKRWRAPSGASTYRTADQWYNDRTLNPNPQIVRTVEEQNTDPYPGNLQTICYYDSDSKIVSVDEVNKIIYTYWDDDSMPHECMRPCKILERYPDSENPNEFMYTAEMLHFDGEEKFWFCAIREGKHISRDVTYDGILILDKPYTHDMFLEQAFRHEISVPEGFYPKEWMRPKVRRKEDTTVSRSDIGDEFRKKKVGEVLTKKQKMVEDNIKSSRSDL
ncbi:hypothetical protein ACHAXN_007258 [Cyclotella atomus]